MSIYIYKVFGDVWKRISKSERTSFNHKSDSLRLHGSLSSFFVPHSLFLYKCAAKRKVQRETHHKMCSRKYEKYASRNAYACLRLLIHYNTNSVLTSNYSPNDYAPQRARSCTPANNERGGGALRPGVGSPLKIFALARCMQHEMTVYHLRISSDGSSS